MPGQTPSVLRLELLELGSGLAGRLGRSGPQGNARVESGGGA